MKLLISLLLMATIWDIECSYSLKYQINNAVQDYDFNEVFALSPTRNQLVYCKKGLNKCVFSDIDSLYQKRSFQTPSQVSEIKWFEDGTIYIAGSYWARIIEQFYPYSITNEAMMEQNQTNTYKFDGIQGLIGVQENQYSIMIFQDSEVRSNYLCSYQIINLVLVSQYYFYVQFEKDEDPFYSSTIAKIQINYLSTIFQIHSYSKALQIFQIDGDYSLIIDSNSATVYYRSLQRSRFFSQGSYRKAILSTDKNIFYQSYSTYTSQIFQSCFYDDYLQKYECDDQQSIRFSTNITNFEINQDYFVFLAGSSIYVFTYEQPIPDPFNFPYFLVVFGGSFILLVTVVILCLCLKRFRKNKKEHQQSLLKSSIKGDAYFAKIKAQVPSQNDQQC